MKRASQDGARPVLALDTSTDVASVAIFGRAYDISAEGRAEVRSDDLISLIDRVLGEAGASLADLAAIAVGAGPGSFTGLRIGMATAKGLCFAAGLPLWSVSSLAALALDVASVDPALDRALVVTVIDVRRGEICAGFFRVTDGHAHAVAEERIVAPAELAGAVAALRADASGFDRVILVGEALAAHREALTDAGHVLAGARATPSARSIARLALSSEQSDVLRSGTPVYIRPSAAEVNFPDGNRGSRLVRPEKE